MKFWEEMMTRLVVLFLWTPSGENNRLSLKICFKHTCYMNYRVCLTKLVLKISRSTLWLFNFFFQMSFRKWRSCWKFFLMCHWTCTIWYLVFCFVLLFFDSICWYLLWMAKLLHSKISVIVLNVRVTITTNFTSS